MVLKNSKWDKQAKHKYLKKHGLLKKKQVEELSSKWSGKNDKSDKNDSDGSDGSDNWSDGDDEILNDMFPELGSVELTKEQREKVKHQILQGLLEQEEQKAKERREVEKNKYNDGIYLGKRPNEEAREDNNIDSNSDSNSNSNSKPIPLTLEEYISKDISTSKKINRKLPKHKISENLLDEYGISSYSEIVKKGDDYNDLYISKQENRPLSKILTEELTNFRIGEDTLGKPTKLSYEKNIIKELDEEESKNFQEIEDRAKQESFIRSMKARFDVDKSAPSRLKVIEINNFNSADQSQVDQLEKRIQKESNATKSDFDLDELLEELNVKSSSTPPTINDLTFNSPIRTNMSSPIPPPWLRKKEIDAFLSELNSGTGDSYVITENPNKITTEYISTSAKPRNMPPPTDEDFIDDLLG